MLLDECQLRFWSTTALARPTSTSLRLSPKSSPSPIFGNGSPSWSLVSWQPTWKTCFDQRFWSGPRHQQPPGYGVASYHTPSMACQFRMGQIGLQYCRWGFSSWPLRDAPDLRQWSDPRHCTFLEDYQESFPGCALCSPRFSSRSSSASTHSTARMEPAWSVRWDRFDHWWVDPYGSNHPGKKCYVWSCCCVAAWRQPAHLRNDMSWSTTCA